MITVKLFGMTKALADNQSSLTLALGKNQSVKNVVELVNKRYPKIGELIYKKKILVSVNQEIAHEDTKVQEGDEVALLPPFAGGALAEGTSRVSDCEAIGGSVGEKDCAGWAGENAWVGRTSRRAQGGRVRMLG